MTAPVRLLDPAGVCTACHLPMEIYEPNQRTHPNCEPREEPPPVSGTDHARPSRDSTHQCPANGCARRVGRDKLACPQHWFMVEPATRRRVYTTYRSGDLEAHRRAMADAIEEINDALTRRATEARR